MRSASLAFVVICAAAGAAHAQSTSGTEIVPTLQDFEGRTGEVDLADLSTTMRQPIALAECDLSITFSFAMVDTARTRLEFYEGSMCNDVTVRNDTTDTQCERLPAPDFAIEGRSEVEPVVIEVRDLITACETGTGSGVETIWVLAVDNESSTVTGNGQMVDFPIAYDFTAPGGPAGFSATDGESSARLTWTQPDESVEQYQVFVDVSGCTDGVVTSTVLTDPPTIEPHDEFAGGTDNYALTWPSGVEIGDEVAVAIRAVDEAGNVGALSAVVCVERIDVMSWRDVYCMENPTECEDGGGCAVSPGRESSPFAALGLLAALGIVLRARALRRRTRR